jgi:hypothetical protein
MNGQNGKVAGTVPTDGKRVLYGFFATTAAATTILLALAKIISLFIG